jgi:hypothetical protein
MVGEGSSPRYLAKVEFFLSETRPLVPKQPSRRLKKLLTLQAALSCWHKQVSTTNMAFPYQCLVACSKTSDSSWTLFGASGSKLVVTSSDGSGSEWPQKANVAVSAHHMMLYTCPSRASFTLCSVERKAESIGITG